MPSRVNRLSSTTVTPLSSVDERIRGVEESKEGPITPTETSLQISGARPVASGPRPLLQGSALLSNSRLVAVNVADHTITQQIFTAFFVTGLSAMYFTSISLKSITSLALINGEGGVGEFT